MLWFRLLLGFFAGRLRVSWSPDWLWRLWIRRHRFRSWGCLRSLLRLRFGLLRYFGALLLLTGFRPVVDGVVVRTLVLIIEIIDVITAIARALVLLGILLLLGCR